MNGLITIVGCVIQSAASGSLAAMYIGRYAYAYTLGETIIDTNTLLDL